MFAAGQAAGIRCILVLLITEDTSKARLAAAGVRVRVDWDAGAMDTPVGWKRERKEHNDLDAAASLEPAATVPAVVLNALSEHRNTHLLPSQGLLTCWSHKVPVQPA